MEPINSDYDEEMVKKTIAEALEDFYRVLISKINQMDLDIILKSKNPYLYRAKSIQKSSEIIESIMQAYVSSSEETIFGNLFFEPLALASSNSHKSTTKGVDMEHYDPETNVQYVVAVKSGPSIFNSSSKDKQGDYFTTAENVLRTARGRIYFEAIVGYCYGTKNQVSGKKRYEELAGEEYWENLTGDNQLYKKIITFMDKIPERYVDEYKECYDNAANRLTLDFSRRFCKDDGSIDWERLVDYNSGSPKRKKEEKLFQDCETVIDLLRNGSNMSKKEILAEANLSVSTVNKIVNFLVEKGTVTIERKGRKNIYILDM